MWTDIKKSLGVGKEGNIDDVYVTNSVLIPLIGELRTWHGRPK